MPRHDRAPSGHDEPRLNRTRNGMMADFRAAKPQPRVVDYFRDATPEQIEKLPEPERAKLKPLR